MVRILTPSDYVRMPWRNGGGATTEIARAPWGQGPDFLWRVSIADVAGDGPFSTFPGIDRQIVVIAGAGMDLLRQDGSVLPLDPFQVRGFPGEEVFAGRLRAGPVRDFNVMVRRGLGAARMVLVTGPAAIPPATIVLLHALSGAWHLGHIAVPEGCTALLDCAAASWALSLPGSRAVLITIQGPGKGAAPELSRACVHRMTGPEAPDPS